MAGKKRPYKTSSKVGQGRKGMPRVAGSGTQKGHMMKNTRELLAKIQGQMDVQDKKHGMSLMEKAYSMIFDDKTQDFVKKDLILGLLKLVTPSMKAIDLSADKPVAAIMFNTNIGPGNGSAANPNQLQCAPDVPSISQ